MITSAQPDLGSSIRNLAAAALVAPDIERWVLVAERFTFEVRFPQNLTDGLVDCRYEVIGEEISGSFEVALERYEFDPIVLEFAVHMQRLCSELFPELITRDSNSRGSEL